MAYYRRRINQDPYNGLKLSISTMVVGAVTSKAWSRAVNNVLSCPEYDPEYDNVIIY